ncbi:hypothetical protein MARCHEWKA_01890 [Brevundimonas phage vB_BpoS-Marchewka]|uniref:Uncharacterized protein n=1 Tax=Brevundimonas phage vB_BpoS-Marchewka TaxID=2948604 RepID=A0A9E7STT5_9CAUD|nr:hypothetical protein MARCHEWKA_01890 [Brevundimonas phage vB_BpoS-Marchewka]
MQIKMKGRVVYAGGLLEIDGFTVSNPLDSTPLGEIPETLTLTGELVMTETQRARFEAWAEEMRAKELARIKALAAASGLSVVYDTTVFEMAWSPQYGADGAVLGWFSNTTDEYRAGPDYPGDDA